MRSKTVDRLLKSTPEDVKIFVDLYADLLVRVNEILREKGISKKELADKLDKKPSEISKWLSGKHNFTLRSLAKLSAELGEPLLEVPKKKTEPHFVNKQPALVASIIVAAGKKAPAKKSKIVKWQSASDFNKLNNVG